MGTDGRIVSPARRSLAIVTKALLWPTFLATCVACSQHSPAPVADRSPVFVDTAAYVVRAGDTLYSIAWRFELDVDELAQRNAVRPPYVIRPGQRIELRENSTRAIAAPSSRPSPGAASTAPQQSAGSTPPPARASTPQATALAGPIRWQAPVSSGLVRGFGDDNNGRDYELQPPESVRAAASGRVVYVGAGLGGYAHLIILRHAGSWLSAYSVNVPPMVAEGRAVKAGGKLADITSKASRLNRLHFEIRKEGDPVDPSTVIR